MSRRVRLTLAVIALAVVSLSLVLLAYSFWPLDSLREQLRLAPTVFAPPMP